MSPASPPPPPAVPGLPPQAMPAAATPPASQVGASAATPIGRLPLVVLTPRSAAIDLQAVPFPSAPAIAPAQPAGAPAPTSPTTTRASAPATANLAADLAGPHTPAQAPIVDRRHQLPWLKRLPARLGTAALWLGSMSLLGPLKLAGLATATLLVLPGALLADELRRQRPGRAAQVLKAATPMPLPVQLNRAAVAEQFCLPESLLFQARHSRICTVVVDSAGRLVDLKLPGTMEVPLAIARPADAHPVG